MVTEAQAIKGFNQVTFNKLQEIMMDRYRETKKSYVELAYELEVKSVSTAQNALTGVEQMVSDQILTNMLRILNLNGMVVWQNGERNYYIKY
jgi:hypothetical protein